VIMLMTVMLCCSPIMRCMCDHMSQHAEWQMLNGLHSLLSTQYIWMDVAKFHYC